MEGLSSPSMVQSGTHTSVLSPLLISMLGIVITAMAIVAYHLLLVKYCKRRRAVDAEAAQLAAAPPPTGVDEKVLAAIPILTFSVVKRGGIDQGECAVCLGELEDEDAVRLLPNCSHAFHVSCIDQWFAAHTSCPLCRLPVVFRQKTDAASASPDLAEDPNNRSRSGENNGSNGSDEPPAPSSGGLLRHCASLMTPMERRSMSRLKRSMSMDLSLVVFDPSATSFSSSSSGILRRSGSLSHFDPKWLSSFPWLRTGKASNASNPILPF
ncbi:RING-H2 finger protein ATL40-like [Salvia miltiorrhiza]|uniref:RING-H2 finger protein ATL40-like n=1 Tax=Salvia miltiorrhiza TaxID=226208 RepID=UPI0025ABA062|nr:RING-H2 finger protein ATL40-like [Salvia miltiorrhiza]